MPDLKLGHTGLIRDECKAAGLTVPQEAYVLATAFWETNRTMLPVEEAYFLGGRAEAYRKTLSYYPWYGRGFAQLTWEDNYVRAGRILRVDMTTDPNVALRPDIAAKVLVIGSRDGWFTGKRLGDYINAVKTDYRNARRVINRLDQSAAIADLALEYESLIGGGTVQGVIRRGSRGAMVVEAQRYLTAQGYDPGAIDGIFGNATDLAAKAFQRSLGLTPDGIIGPKTWDALIPEMD